MLLAEGNSLLPVSPLIVPKTQVLASVTGYTKLETCPDRDCITASGLEADYDLIACPHWIELGTLVEIEDLGFFKCADRTARHIQEKHGHTFDLWFGETEEDYQRAMEFGRQQKEVIIY